MKTSNKLKSLIMGFFCVVTGCAVQPPLDQSFQWSTTTRAVMLKQYENMKNCCYSANDIEFSDYLNNDVLSYNFSISAKDKALKFDTGLSPIKAFKLPVTKHPYKLTVMSHTLRDRGMHCYADCTYMFIPIILFLDSEFMPLYTFLPGDLRLHDPATKPNKKHGYEHKVKIEGDNKAKFFVIYTTPSLIKNSAEYSFKNNAAVYSSDGKSITGSPFGQLSISIDRNKANF